MLLYSFGLKMHVNAIGFFINVFGGTFTFRLHFLSGKSVTLFCSASNNLWLIKVSKLGSIGCRVKSERSFYSSAYRKRFLQINKRLLILQYQIIVAGRLRESSTELVGESSVLKVFAKYIY